MNILIIGHARHGKDTVAEMIQEITGFTFESSSVAASRIFLYDALKLKYGYTSPKQCFEDRVNHRAEWHDMIKEYNQYDPAKLAKEILKTSQIYVGMRSNIECQACIDQQVFSLIIGVYNPRMPLEDTSSFNIDVWENCDVIIPNSGTLRDLNDKVVKLLPTLYNSVHKLKQRA